MSGPPVVLGAGAPLGSSLWSDGVNIEVVADSRVPAQVLLFDPYGRPACFANAAGPAASIAPAVIVLLARSQPAAGGYSAEVLL